MADPKSKPRAPKAANGLGSVYQVGDSWRAALTVDGKKKVVRAKTKVLAEHELRDLLNRRDDGTLTAGKSSTFEAWSTHWVQNIAELSPLTRAGYVSYLERYISPAIGSTTLEKLRPEHLEKLYASMKDGTHSRTRGSVGPATVRQTHSIIRRALRIAVQRGLVARNVALLTTIPSVPKAKTEALSVADTQALLAAAKASPYRARWIIALLLGLRPGEALGLTWEDIDLEGGEIRVSKQLQFLPGRGAIIHEGTKTAAGNRAVKLPSFLVDVLREHRADQLRIRVELGEEWKGFEFAGKPIALVFCQRSGIPIPPRLDADNWERLVASAGLPHTRRYTARHTAATIMLEQSGDVAVVAATLGHSDPSFTYRVYVHAQEDKKVALAEKLNVFDVA